MRELLIDGDILAYLFAHRCEEIVRVTPRLWARQAREDRGRAEIGSFINELVEDLEAHRAVVALSDIESNFRHTIFGGYKAGRNPVERPMLFYILRDFMFTEYDAVSWPNLEGDDVLGILATQEATHGGQPVERIVCTIDKDLHTVPGLLFDWKNAHLGVQEVTPEDAERFHLFQTLVGDRTDGYPGCPKIGPVNANRILDHDCSWDAVVKAFEKAKLSEEVALMNARCARILQDGDYNHETGEVYLWNPPKEVTDVEE